MYLYCISDGVLCKFGYSEDPSRRLRSLQTGSSSVLSLVHTIVVDCDLDIVRLERTLHKEFAHHRVRGEWFRCTSEEGVRWLTWFEMRYLN